MQEKEALLHLPTFLLHRFFFFLPDIPRVLPFCVFPVERISYGHSFLLAANALNFSSSENILDFPFIPEGHLPSVLD